MTDTAWQCLLGVVCISALCGLLAFDRWLDDRSEQREHELKLKGKK